MGMLLIIHSSCDKFLDIAPPNYQLSPQSVFDNDDAASAALIGIYGRMINGTPGAFANGGVSSITSLAGLSSDEFICITNTTNYQEFYKNALIPTNSILELNLWSGTYQYIYSANAILEGISNNNGVSDELKKTLEGEAKFIRAFCFFYLTNLFGDIPMPLTTDYRTNSSATRHPKSEILKQIISDLKAAKSLLSSDYVSGERTRPNKWVAISMLARTYLYDQNWINAEAESSQIIDNPQIFSLNNDLNQVFKKNSSEAIWQLVPNRSGYNANEGELFIPLTVPIYLSMTEDLINAFEPGDKRKSDWTKSLISGGKTYRYPFKYKIRQGTPVSEYSMVLRLGEQYLIRAESRIHLNKIALGIQDINELRNRARSSPTIDIPTPLPALAETLTLSEALIAIEKERRIELFSEWGHRWLDLKRTDRADIILSGTKGPNWESTDILYPIPQLEVNASQ